MRGPFGDPAIIDAGFAQGQAAKPARGGNPAAFGLRIAPAMNFGVSVGKGKPGRAIMVGSGQVTPVGSLAPVRVVPNHSVVDAVGVFVERDEGRGGLLEVA